MPRQRQRGPQPPYKHCREAADADCLFFHTYFVIIFQKQAERESVCYNHPQFGIAVHFRGDFDLHANLVNSNAVRAVRRRGNLNNGANYGPRYVNANNAPSNSNWNYGSGHLPCVQSTPSILSQSCTAFPRFRRRNQNTIRLESAW